MLRKIAIAADHAGIDLKTALLPYLLAHDFEVKDFGTQTKDSIDYPDVVHPLCEALLNNEFEAGILICGSAQGVAITANKHPNIRAAICWMPAIAGLARQHNNANIICLPARFIDLETAITSLNTFFNTSFEGGRHQTRVDKINGLKFC
jgi:ribose 5-phosphate isomerase B